MDALCERLNSMTKMTSVNGVGDAGSSPQFNVTTIDLGADASASTGG